MDNIDKILDEWADAKGRKDELNAELKALNGVIAERERNIIAYHEQTELTKFGNDHVTVSVNPDALRAKYSPDQWQDIIKWAVESGNDHIIQRRLTDAKVVELVENGTELPDGLSLDSYIKLSLRRK